MTLIVKILALFSVALIAGGWMMGSFLVTPAQKKLDAQQYIAVEQANTSVGARYFPAVMITTIVLLVVLLVLTARARGPVVLVALSLAFVIAGLAFTAVRMVPINKEVESWSVQSPPSDWQETRDAWHANHRIRTTLAVIAFLLLCGAIVQNPTKVGALSSAGKTKTASTSSKALK